VGCHGLCGDAMNLPTAEAEASWFP